MGGPSNLAGDDRRKHLEFIQNVITRMNANSFQIKTWTITIMAAMLALAASGDRNRDLLVGCAIVPVVASWFLDAYYLWQERRFRELYRRAVDGNIALFSMNPELVASSTEKAGRAILDAMFSVTLRTFYLMLLLLLILLTILASLV